LARHGLLHLRSVDARRALDRDGAQREDRRVHRDEHKGDEHDDESRERDEHRTAVAGAAGEPAHLGLLGATAFARSLTEFGAS
jgi:hypothetical protein